MKLYDSARPQALGTLDSLRPRRRTVALGAAWSVPAVALAAPAAHAGVSQCQVSGSLTLAPNQTMNVRAVCTSQSQYLRPGTIYQNYATSSLPPYLEICNCQNADAWYRWRETDTLDNFQIEVDGVHIDQNSPAAGWRSPFFLPSFGNTGGCKRFNLTYRTSVPRSRDNNAAVTVTFTLETGRSRTGPWTQVGTPLVRSGWIRRNTGGGPADVDFDSCSAGGTPMRGSASTSVIPD